MGCPQITHVLCFETVKTVPSLCEMDKKTSMCWVPEIDEMNGLICVEMDRLMHELSVLAGCHNYMEYNCVYRSLEMEF